MVESGWVPGKGRIRATIEKLSVRVSEKGRISVSIGNWYNLGEYREKLESVRVPNNCPVEYRKMVQSAWVPENGRIRVSQEKVESVQVMKTCPGEYQKRVESMREPENGIIQERTERR